MYRPKGHTNDDCVGHAGRGYDSILELWRQTTASVANFGHFGYSFEKIDQTSYWLKFERADFVYEAAFATHIPSLLCSFLVH